MRMHYVPMTRLSVIPRYTYRIRHDHILVYRFAFDTSYLKAFKKLEVVDRLFPHQTETRSFHSR